MDKTRARILAVTYSWSQLAEALHSCWGMLCMHTNISTVAQFSNNFHDLLFLMKRHYRTPVWLTFDQVDWLVRYDEYLIAQLYRFQWLDWCTCGKCSSQEHISSFCTLSRADHLWSTVLCKRRNHRHFGLPQIRISEYCLNSQHHVSSSHSNIVNWRTPWIFMACYYVITQRENYPCPYC